MLGDVRDFHCRKRVGSVMPYEAVLERVNGRKTMPKEMGVEESGEEPGYSAAKEAVARDVASALGIDPETIDAPALCDALKKLIELE